MNLISGFLRVLAIMAVCEAMIMIVLRFVGIHGAWAILIDIVSLPVVCAPAIYAWVVKPSEAQLRTILENISEGVAASDLDGRLLHFNRAALDLHGFATLEECRRHLTQFADDFELSAMDGTVWPVDQWPLARILRGESLHDLDVRIRHLKAGWRRVYSYGGALARGAGGRPLMAVVTMRDITERLKMEAALSVQVRIGGVFLTVDDDEMFSEVLKVILGVLDSPFGIFGYIDEDGALVVPTMTREIWDKCRIAGKTMRFPRETWGNSSWPRAIREKRVILSNEPSAGVPEGHVPIRRHIAIPILLQGEVVGLLQAANKGSDYAEDDVQALQSIADQIAPYLHARLRRERAEGALRRLNAELEDRVRARTALLEAANMELEAFVYSISHDLRAPLRAIDGFSQILMDDYAPKLAPECRRYLGLVRGGARAMGQLIDDLLAFSRLSRQAMVKSAVSMEAVVRSVLATLNDQRQGRQVKLKVGELAPCVGDSALLGQVWANLLSNALKFTRARPEALIEIDSHDEAGETVYRVKDNGVGFDMRHADKLFKVFSRLHSAAEYEGTGGGLSIVARIVERHGGRVWARSESGRGAEFFFTLGGRKG